MAWGRRAMTTPIATMSIKKLVGEDAAGVYRELRIRTVGKLLDAAASPKARITLAAKLYVHPSAVLTLATRADLMRVHGLGAKYIDMLHTIKVMTVRELSYRNARNLFDELTALNARHKTVDVLPSIGMVMRWIAHAKTLPTIITHR